MRFEEIVDKITSRAPGVPREEVERRVRIFEGFCIPPAEIITAVLRSLRKDYNITRPTIKLHQVPEHKGRAVDTKFKVLKVSPVKSSKIAARAIVADETGVASAIMTSTDILQAGKVYSVKNAFVTSGKNPALAITKTSVVVELNEDMKVKPYEFSGAIVAIGERSGLVPRCPECQGLLNAGICSQHGKVKPTLSYEARVVVDNGSRATSFTVRGKDLEKISGLEIKEAERIKVAYGDFALWTELANRLVGRYVHVRVSDGATEVTQLPSGGDE